MNIGRFRLRVWLMMMAMTAAATGAALWVSKQQLEAEAASSREREFAGAIASQTAALRVREEMLIARCRMLAGRARLHAALEDNAVDLLYPSAESELSDLIAGDSALRARWYRFLDRMGHVIPVRPKSAVGPGAGSADGAAVSAGALPASAEAALQLSTLPSQPALGFLHTPSGAAEIVATPIISSETRETIAALVVGFDPAQSKPPGAADGSRPVSATQLTLPGDGLDARLDAAIARAPNGGRFETVGANPSLRFFSPLNAGSPYPRAYVVTAYSLSGLRGRESRLRWEIIGTGAAVLALALIGTRFASRELAAPVEKLVLESERSARFSADASHQLKTPVTVLRAGLEELLRQPDLAAAHCTELESLVHQTYRLSTLIDDLLLLARLDAGRLRLQVSTVDLSALIEAGVDDLGAQPEGETLAIEAEIPPAITIAGEQRYTAIILQNLLENARKYNRAGGKIRVRCGAENGTVAVDIGNTGATIAPPAQAAIFERFHRAAVGENIPGYGLGLNLARELARLHGGDLELLTSGSGWTEFRWTMPRASAS